MWNLNIGPELIKNRRSKKIGSGILIVSNGPNYVDWGLPVEPIQERGKLDNSCVYIQSNRIRRWDLKRIGWVSFSVSGIITGDSRIYKERVKGKWETEAKIDEKEMTKTT